MNLEGVLRSQDDMISMLYELTVPAVHSTFHSMYKAFCDAYDNEPDIDRDLKHSVSRASKWTNHDVRGVVEPYLSMEKECLSLTYSIVRCGAHVKYTTGIISTPDIDFQTNFPDVLHAILIYASRVLTMGNNIECIKDDTSTEETSSLLREKKVVENALTSLSKKAILEVMHKNGEAASQAQRQKTDSSKELERIRRTTRREEEERVEQEERAKIRAKAKARALAAAQEEAEEEAKFQKLVEERSRRAKERSDELERIRLEDEKLREEKIAEERRVIEEARASAEAARAAAEEEAREWRQKAQEQEEQSKKDHEERSRKEQDVREEEIRRVTVTAPTQTHDDVESTPRRIVIPRAEDTETAYDKGDAETADADDEEDGKEDAEDDMEMESEVQQLCQRLEGGDEDDLESEEQRIRRRLEGL